MSDRHDSERTRSHPEQEDPAQRAASSKDDNDAPSNLREHPASAHGHTHGIVDPSIFATEQGLWDIKWSFAGLFGTTIIQFVIFYFSNSIALLADTIHNLGDAFTAVPLGLAFIVGRRKPTKRFTYGYGRLEDLAGVAVILTIFVSAVWAGYESISRFVHPRAVSNLWAVAAASIIGFLGNEGVAIFRMKVGREMGSAALVADGYHARVDGFASLSVLLSVIGIALGFPYADAIVGTLMTLLILRIVWESGAAVFTRILDGVDPEVVDIIRREAMEIAGVTDVSDVRVRWLGHRLHAEINVAVDQGLSVEEGHNIASEVRHSLLHELQFLSNATIHVDPAHTSGEKHHQIEEHEHGEEPPHSHL